MLSFLPSFSKSFIPWVVFDYLLWVLHIQYNIGTTENLKAYLKSPSISTPFKKQSHGKEKSKRIL